MKKYLLIILLFIPMIVFAKSDYVIDKYYIDASINNNGDLEVQEILILNGTFDEFTREINYRNSSLTYNDPIDFLSDAIYNGHNLDNVSIKAKYLEETIDPFALINSPGFTPLIRVYYEEDAKNTNYVESSHRDGKKYRMYFKAEKQRVAFLISYQIKSVVVKHQDTLELYWPFLNNLNNTVNETKIRISLPSLNTNNTINAFTHSNSSPSVSFFDESNNKINTNDNTLIKSIQIESNNLSSPLVVRILFTNTLETIPASKCSNTLALKKIIETESNHEIEEQEQKEKNENINNTIEILSIITLLIILLWWQLVYIMFKKKHKHSFNELYYTNPNNTYSIEVLPYLLSGKINESSFISSIMNLIIKKNIIVEEYKEKNQIFYKLILDNTKDTTETESILIDLLFDKVGKNKTLTMKELANYSSGSKTKDLFIKYYNNWLNCVQKDALRENFYERNGIPIISSIFILFVSIMISFASIYFNAFQEYAILLVPLAILFMYDSFNIKRRSIKGEEEYAKWQAFKNYLNDFKEQDSKDIPSPDNIDRIIPFSLIFNLNNNIKEKIKDNKDYKRSNEYLDVAEHIFSNVSIIIEESKNNGNKKDN